MVYALEERDAFLSKDPYVQKFDAERILCAICDRWISVSPDNHLDAVQGWLQHRAYCQKFGPVTSHPAGADYSEFPRQRLQQYVPRVASDGVCSPLIYFLF